MSRDKFPPSGRRFGPKNIAYNSISSHPYHNFNATVMTVLIAIILIYRGMISKSFYWNTVCSTQSLETVENSFLGAFKNLNQLGIGTKANKTNKSIYSRQPLLNFLTAIFCKIQCLKIFFLRKFWIKIVHSILKLDFIDKHSTNEIYLQSIL